MTLARFIVKNTFRNKRRTAFTVLSIGFSLFLLIALFTVLDLLTNPPSSDAAALRLVVKRSTSLADSMPLAYAQKLRQVPNVERVMPFQWFGGYYKEPKNFFANLAGDPRMLFPMFPELTISEATQHAFESDRQAAVAGEGLMERYGWNVGDRITLKGTIFPIDLEFKIVGTYANDIDDNGFYFRFDYLNEARGDPGTTGTFWLTAKDAASIPGIIETIDGMFRNSAAETKTESEKSFQLSFVEMLGNIRLMIGSIGLVVVFTMLLVAASTMAMTIRERTREVAILKSIGFQRSTVLTLILSESVLIGMLGLLLGAFICQLLGRLDMYTITQGFIPYFRPPRDVYLGTLATSLLIGLFSGLWPAWHASNLTITEGMKRID